MMASSIIKKTERSFCCDVLAASFVTKRCYFFSLGGYFRSLVIDEYECIRLSPSDLEAFSPLLLNAEREDVALAFFHLIAHSADVYDPYNCLQVIRVVVTRVLAPSHLARLLRKNNYSLPQVLLLRNLYSFGSVQSQLQQLSNKESVPLHEDLESVLDLIESQSTWALHSSLDWRMQLPLQLKEISCGQPRIVRVGVIACGALRTHLGQSLSDMIYEWLCLSRSLSSIHIIFSEVKTWSASKGDIPSVEDCASCDILALTGSSSSAASSDPWVLSLSSLLKTVIQERKAKVIGICFGHQIIARALGGTVRVNPHGIEIGHRHVQLRDVAFDVFGSANQLCLPTSHADTVGDLPPGAVCLAQNEFGNQMYRWNNHVVGIQGHPEFDKNMSIYCCDLRFRRGTLSLEQYEEAIDTIKTRDTDGPFLGACLLRYFFPKNSLH